MKYRIIEHNWEDTSIVSDDGTLCRLSIHDLGIEVTEENQGELETKISDRATMIIEALNSSTK